MKNYNTFINENSLSTVKRMIKRNVLGTYKEPVYVYIRIYDDYATISNEWLDSKVNRKLMKMLDDKFNLELSNSSLNQIDKNIVDEICDFLDKFNLESSEHKGKDIRIIVYSGKLSLQDLK